MRKLSLVLAVLACYSTAVAADSKPVPLGTKVADFALRDFRGQSHDSAAEAKDKIVVLAFLGTECPLCKLYTSRLNELAKAYEGKGVVFWGLDPNRQDAITEIASFARVHEIEFPILKDLNQTIADRVGATRTPEIVVLDASRAIRYRGRIDDQYGFKSNANYQKPKPGERNLVNTLDELLAGKPVSVAETAAPGCLIGRDRKADPNAEVTYSNQIARIMNANCVFCHRDGQIAPFSLTNYEEMAGWAGMVQEVVESQRMPPWHADPSHGTFQNDARLSDADKAAIAKWVAAGAPEGNPKDLPEPPQYAEGWMIPKPDEVLYMRDEPFEVPETGVVDYQMFVVDPGWKEDKWIAAVEPRPGNAAVVHHILMFVVPPTGANLGIGRGNDFLAAYAPGARPYPLPTGQARFVPAGSKLIFQMHYTPNGSAQKDRSYCGFVFADPKTVEKEVRVSSAINFVFNIPPGNDNFPVNARYVFREDTLLLTMMPHMHLRGKAFRYDAVYPDGKREVLLDVPGYDFGWQTSYRLAEPKLLPKGTRLECLAHFDNSKDNLNNPDPKKSVRFGDQTFEEMMIGFFESMPAHEDRLHPEKAAPPQSRLEEFNVIMKATGGQPDENIKVGSSFALMAPEIFSQFSMILQSLVPQVDRVCITTVDAGQIKELYGPSLGMRRDRGGKGKDGKPATASKEQDHNEAAEKLVIQADNIRSKLPETPAEGEDLATFVDGDKVVVIADISKAKGKLFETMAKRGAKSSMHVPAMVKGKRVTVNFWSTDPNAFTPQAESVLTDVAKTMTAPKKGLTAFLP